MKQGEVLFVSNNNVLISAYEWLPACWHLLRSDEIALIVQNYRNAESKNKRHKQVRHCLPNTYKLVVNSVNWESKIWNPLFPMLRGSPLIVLFKLPHNFLDTSLPHNSPSSRNSHNPHAPFSLQKSTALVRTNRLQSETLPVHMAFSGKSSFVSGMSAQERTGELQTH